MNIYEEVALLEGTLERDIKALEPILEEIAFLIDQNPFSRRIWFLLANRNIATNSVQNAKGELKPPNCLGTALFVAGLGSFNYPYHAYDDELGPHMERKIEGEVLAGAFCFSPSYSLDGVDYHAGIVLGLVDHEPVLFAQHGRGSRFGPESLSRCYEKPSFYIPATLIA